MCLLRKLKSEDWIASSFCRRVSFCTFAPQEHEFYKIQRLLGLRCAFFISLSRPEIILGTIYCSSGEKASDFWKFFYFSPEIFSVSHLAMT